MKLQSAFLSTTIVSAMILSGCSTADPPTTGSGGSTTSKTGGSSGSTGKGGSGGSGGGEGCDKVSPCGGDVAATWEAKSSCLKTSGTADISYLGLACLTAQVAGSINVTGTLTLGSDGKYSDKTVAKGSDKWELDAACLNLSGTKVTCDGISSVFAATLTGYGYEEFKCVNASSGGGCSCEGKVNSTGGIGLLYNDLTPTGKYTSADNTLSLGDGLEYSYCVKEKELTLTPKPGTRNSTPFTGTIVFENAGGGSGGAGGGGSGGASGEGGRGGSTAAGGSTSSGGRGGAGGGAGGRTGGGTGGSTTATGGRTGVTTGGTTTAGGATGSGTGGTTGGGSGGTTAAGGSGGGTGGGTGGGKEGPCDIYKAANMPCAAAFSVVRVLSKSYTGPLFQVRAGSSSTNNTMSGGTTKDIMPGSDGFVEGSAVDAACGSGYCTVSVLYDQSGNENHIKRAPKGNTAGGATGALDDYESCANSAKAKVKAGGHDVYGLYMNKVEGYRSTVVGKGMPTGSQPQGTYMLADGTRKATACCWDFGNVTTKPATEWAFMDTICLGHTWWGNSTDPNWFGFAIDFEGGVWAGGSKSGDPGWGALSGPYPFNSNNPSMDKAKFALGVIRVSQSEYAIRVADLSTATELKQAWKGGLPVNIGHKGGIVLGVGGDNSNNSAGTFYEGAMVAGYPTDDTEAKVMANIKAAGYSQ